MPTQSLRFLYLAFLYGRAEDLEPGTLVARALHPSGRLEAFASWRRLPASRGLVLDLIRRRPGGVPGAVDLLITDTIRRAPELETSWLSLGGCTMLDEAPVWLRLPLRALGVAGGRGLWRFKDKFNPRWQDRYLALPQGASGLIGAAALALAYLGWGHDGQPPSRQLSAPGANA